MCVCVKCVCVCVFTVERKHATIVMMVCSVMASVVVGVRLKIDDREIERIIEERTRVCVCSVCVCMCVCVCNVFVWVCCVLQRGGGCHRCGGGDGGRG